MIRLLLCTHLLLGSALAHDPGLSSSRVELSASAVEIELAFANADAAHLAPIDVDRDGRISAAELANGCAALLETLDVALSVDGVVATRAEAEIALADNDDVRLRLRFSRPGGTRVSWSVGLLDRLARGHRQYASIHDEAGELCGEALLKRGAVRLHATVEGRPSAVAQAVRFVELGVEHILIGYDHILFLLALLLAGGGLRAAAAVITSFTIAHSLTLGLASLDLVRLPAALVEPVIAASIVWVGIENLLRDRPRHRWRTTFAFGLVHGFGFASVLRELGVAEASGIAVPLVSFNLGVELGQLAIAVFALPLVWWLRRHASRRWLAVLSSSVVAVGAWWLIERVLPW